MIFGKLTIGPKPDYTLKIGKVLLKHRMMVQIIKSGRRERKFGASNPSLASLIKYLGEIFVTRAPNGKLTMGKSIFAVCFDPTKSTMILLHPRWHPEMDDEAKSRLWGVYIKEFGIEQPGP